MVGGIAEECPGTVGSKKEVCSLEVLSTDCTCATVLCCCKKKDKCRPSRNHGERRAFSEPAVSEPAFISLRLGLKWRWTVGVRDCALQPDILEIGKHARRWLVVGKERMVVGNSEDGD